MKTVLPIYGFRRPAEVSVREPMVLKRSIVIGPKRIRNCHEEDPYGFLANRRASVANPQSHEDISGPSV